MDTHIQSQNTKLFIHELINLIYQAALQPLLWPETLNDIRILCGADQCTLFFYDAFEPHRCLASAARVDEATLTQYLKKSIQQQATQVNNQLKVLPEGQVVIDQEIYELVGKNYSDIVGEEYMQTFWPNLKFEAGIVLLRGETSCAGLGLQNFENSPSIPQQSIDLLQELSPHLRHAMRLHQDFMRLEHTNDALKAVLQASHAGIVLLDEKFNIQFINYKAQQSLKKISHLPIHQQLFLEITGKEQLHKIVPGIECMIKSYEETTEDDESTFSHPNGHLKINSYALQEISASAGHLLLIQDSNSSCDLDLQYLQSAYEITATERKLISGLINGSSLLESADSQMVKPSTIRWHLKNIMQKTLTHSQPELTRLMLELRT
jgi:DNA-binding CsgD family transcriptional regulator